jgi:hypothetical protein
MISKMIRIQKNILRINTGSSPVSDSRGRRILILYGLGKMNKLNIKATSTPTTRNRKAYMFHVTTGTGASHMPPAQLPRKIIIKKSKKGHEPVRLKRNAKTAASSRAVMNANKKSIANIIVFLYRILTATKKAIMEPASGSTWPFPYPGSGSFNAQE